MKKLIALSCLTLTFGLAGFILAPQGYIEDKKTGMRIMYYDMKVATAVVKQNGAIMKGSTVKSGDKLSLYISGVEGFITKGVSGHVFPAVEVSVTDQNNNVLYESPNLLTIGESGVTVEAAKEMSCDITPSEKWPAGTYKWEVKFWDLNGPGIILSDMKIVKK
jgi:hypothetical protein